jgi:phage tail sheath protein FI
MATYNRPGVFINELPLAAAPVNLAATANAAGAVIAAFERGSDQITKVTSWYDFTQTFGGYNAKYPATFSIGSFFKNGGSELYVKRIFPASSKKVAKATVGYTGNGTGTLCTIASKHRGVDGNNIRVVIASSKTVRLTGYYDITVYYDANNPTTNSITDDTVVEQFNGVIFHDATSGDYAPTVLAFGSDYITILEGLVTEYDSSGNVISPKTNYSVAKNILNIPQTDTVVLAGAPSPDVDYVYADYTGNTVYNPAASPTGTFSVTDCSVFKEFEVVDQPLVFFLPDVVGRVADTSVGKTATPTSVFYNNTADSNGNKLATFTTATAHPFLAGETLTISGLTSTTLDTAVGTVGTASSSAAVVTVTSTANLRVGMTVTKSSGTGTIPSGTTILSITNGTTFVLSATPSVALSGATLAFASSSLAFLNTALTVTAVTTTSPYTFTVAVPTGGTNDIGSTTTPRELSAGTAAFDTGSGWGIAKEVYKALQSWSETDNSSKRHFVLIETSPNLSVDEALSQAGDLNSSSRSAVYYPQVYIKDPLGKSGNAVRKIGPSGAVAGLYLATDRRVGAFKAAAGIDAVIKDAIALERAFSPSELDQLNSGTSSTGSIVGKNVVNAIRNVPGAGVVVMGGRTLLQDGSANRYINMRRSLSYIEKRLNDLSTFALFENNTETLWARLITVLGVFLNDYRNQGGLRGTTPEQSFYIKCDEENNTVATIQAGEVHVEIGVALEYPAEFVVINLSQKTAE